MGFVGLPLGFGEAFLFASAASISATALFTLPGRLPLRGLSVSPVVPVVDGRFAFADPAGTVADKAAGIVADKNPTGAVADDDDDEDGAARVNPRYVRCASIASWLFDNSDIYGGARCPGAKT